MKKINKYGCRPSQDVCLEHDSPLVAFGFCEDSPEIKEFVEAIKAQSRQEVIEEMLNDLESNPNLDGSISPNIQHWIEQKKMQLKSKYLPPIN